MICESFRAGSFGCNATILGDSLSHQAVVVDPGDAVEEILLRLKKHDLTVIAIVHTHAHVDHTVGACRLSKLTGAPTFLHQADQALHANMDLQALALGMRLNCPAPMDFELRECESISFGPYELGVLHTPGHTPGSVCLIVPTENLCLTGDTLFKGGIGHTTAWGGDPFVLRNSIRDRLFHLPGATKILPGHGESSTIEEERLTNPYVRLNRTISCLR